MNDASHVTFGRAEGAKTGDTVPQADIRHQDYNYTQDSRHWSPT